MSRPSTDVEVKFVQKDNKRGARPTMKAGHARTVRLDPICWERTPSPKSAFLRQAIDAYLRAPQKQPERARSIDGRFTPNEITNGHKVTCVYLPDAQWKRMAELKGAISNHVNIALKRALNT